MKTTLIVLLAGLGLILMGNAKAEITSECTLGGTGDYQCNFENKGKKKDSTCIHMILGPKGVYEGHIIFVSVKEEEYEKFRAQLDKDSEYCQQHIGTSIDENNRCVDVHETKIKELKDVASLEERRRIHMEAFHNLMSEQKKIAIASGKKLDIYVKENLLPLSYLMLGGLKMGLSGEICSGIVEPNDVRERHGTVVFSGVPLGYADLDSAHSNLTPYDVCQIAGIRSNTWTEVCSFSTITKTRLHELTKNSIEKTP